MWDPATNTFYLPYAGVESVFNISNMVWTRVVSSYFFNPHRLSFLWMVALKTYRHLKYRNFPASVTLNISGSMVCG